MTKNKAVVLGLLASCSFLLTSCGSSDEKAADVNTGAVAKQATASGNEDIPKNPLAEAERPVPKAEVKANVDAPESIKDEDALQLIKDKGIKFDQYKINDKTIVVVGREEHKKLGKRGIELITLLNAYAAGTPAKELTIDGKLRAVLDADGKTIKGLSLLSDPTKEIEVNEKNVFKLLLAE